VKLERKHVADQWRKQLDAANLARQKLEAELAQFKNAKRFSKKGPGRFGHPNPPPGTINAPGLGTPIRRGSRIPLPERPTTPLNPTPPHRFGTPREPSSGNSTLQSLNSMYSRTTAATVDSNESEKSFRSPTPDSPTAIQLPLSPVLSHKDLHDDKSEADAKSVTSAGDVAAKPAKTWAQMLRKPVDGQTVVPPPPVVTKGIRVRTPANWRVSSAF
jgi:hypothetical protein